MASLFRSILRLLKAKARRSKLPVLDLSEDLLREIFLRIGSPADLIRASAACVTFRRLIADPCFLRRYRSIHPPLLLGFLYNKSIFGTLCFQFQPAETPHPNAPAAGAVARASNFCFRSYLPIRSNPWEYRDTSNGRILVDCIREGHGFAFPDLAVCDPLSSCRWRLLPVIPDDLLASVKVEERNLITFRAFLVPSRSEDDETLFRVIAIMDCVTKLLVCVFSSDSNSWRLGTSRSWDDLNVARDKSLLRQKPQRAHGCFFWKVNRTNQLVKLDTAMMELSTDNLPSDHHVELYFVIMEAGEDRLALFSQTFKGASLNYYTSVQNKSKSYVWQMMNVIPLPPIRNIGCSIFAGAEGYIFLTGYSNRRPNVNGLTCFSLEVKTLKIQKVSKMDLAYYYILPFFGYPPAMSPRMI
ncbi:unnamed protein product [Urochloa humidicola]